jgi:hypothetical protein
LPLASSATAVGYRNCPAAPAVLVLPEDPVPLVLLELLELFDEVLVPLDPDPLEPPVVSVPLLPELLAAELDPDPVLPAASVPFRMVLLRVSAT